MFFETKENDEKLDKMELCELEAAKYYGDEIRTERMRNKLPLDQILEDNLYKLHKQIKFWHEYLIKKFLCKNPVSCLKRCISEGKAVDTHGTIHGEEKLFQFADTWNEDEKYSEALLYEFSGSSSKKTKTIITGKRFLRLRRYHFFDPETTLLKRLSLCKNSDEEILWEPKRKRKRSENSNSEKKHEVIPIVLDLLQNFKTPSPKKRKQNLNK